MVLQRAARRAAAPSKPAKEAHMSKAEPSVLSRLVTCSGRSCTSTLPVRAHSSGLLISLSCTSTPQAG